jgi:hypothetical protein
MVVLLASACAGQAAPTSNASSRGNDDACTHLEQPDISAETAERLVRASNVVEYENIWRDDHPGATLGSVNSSAISALIRSKTADVQGCYESALDKLPGGRGRVVTRFVIDFSGKVRNVSITSNDFQVPAVGCCLANHIAQWAFPVPTNGEFVVVEYPFVVHVSNGK